MPQKPNGAAPHELPLLVHQMKGESQPFLNDVQRQALDAALAAKLSKLSAGGGGGSSSKGRLTGRGSKELVRGPSKSEATQDKKSRTGKSKDRVSKKDGAGGKYTWGGVMDGPDTRAELDPRDPNYDSGDDGSPVEYSLQAAAHGPDTLPAFKQLAVEMLEEYFVSGDVGEVARQLQDAGQPQFGWALVKKAVTVAMDRHDKEREMASVLLSSLYGEVLAPEEVQKGFADVVAALDDLKLDVPGAAGVAATFMARAVVDDILPPAFVSKLPADEGSAAAEAKAGAEAQLKARHVGERAARCWGARAGLSPSEATRAAITQLLQEYTVSGDVGEARVRLRELAAPFFHHDVVKQALLSAMQEPKQRSALLALLQQLVASADIPSSQLVKGFQRVADNLEDTSLDNPRATTDFPSIVSEAQAAGWLDSSFQAEAATPTSGNTGSSVAAYKAAAGATIDEYFASGEAGEVVRRLVELDEPALANMFVKQLVMRAMERKSRECEAASVLLAALHPKLIDPQQASLGFTRLLAAADDASLDTPTAAHLLALFVGRAVVDEVLPPAFLVAVLPALQDGCLGVSVVHAAGAMLKARHAAERLQNAWHGGLSTIDQLRASMQTTLAEFVSSHDEPEAARSLAELSTPHYHHEFVKRALVMAFETPASAPALLSLLAHLAHSSQVTQTQMRKGFTRVETDLDDIKLDCPNAPKAFAEYKQQAEEAGWLWLQPDSEDGNDAPPATGTTPADATTPATASSGGATTAPAAL
mmetsp:Transcript_19931/g.60231  ORF Transcript_19931/g.60231 Transcript_19931/m.60231 type:complete len:760 (-) Transcript_19931:626-2905(-)|eukprot:CAMPEP_0206139210 /NCGR_PEP_ID=MMETSP1473-20131121/4907_1 /ASSEMBLY_ACC=CAM_ASM_001109 /TAXON_ID=1461547 /ORGANISM="Stichococcus sp, Strain RCC1054" /LENGTH=759 /DNA_ID=CAMNT_0053532877 /DNA_START=300 /DNA_END=2579 /DNA_ORIENTATION=+